MAEIAYGDQTVGDIASLVISALAHETNGGVEFVVVPAGHKVEAPDFESRQLRPSRKRGTLVVRDVADFVAYVNKHKTDGTLITADLAGDRNIVAYLNGHEPEPQFQAGTADSPSAKAGWGDHRCSLNPRWTPGWTAWTGFGGRWLRQEEFAEFLIERMGEIAEPNGGVLFEIARSLRLSYNAESEKTLNRDNGDVQIVFKEATTTSVEVPTKFTLVLVPFDGVDAVQLKARLKISRPKDGPGCLFQWNLGEGPRLVLDTVFGDLRARVFADTGLDVLRGSWASA